MTSFASRVSSPPRRDYFAELGLSPIINVSGTETAYGAAPICEEALAAAGEVGPAFVDMRELQRAAGQRVAAAFGTEAGMVAHCSAAGIAIAIAACMAGDDPRLIHQLPDTAGMKNEVILQRGHRVDYGAPITQNIRLTGAEVHEIGTDSRCSVEDLEAAITTRTAAALFVVSHHTVPTGMLALEVYCKTCHARDVPVVVDAAAEPDARVFLDAGADLVITSAHKRYAGLTAAMIAGKAALVRSSLSQEHGIGRPMKVSKEALIGTIAALERWQGLDATAAARALDSRLSRAQSRLSRIPGVVATIVADAVSGQFSRLHLELTAAALPLTARELAARLLAWSPRVVVRETTDGVLQLDFRLVSDEIADVVVEGILAATLPATSHGSMGPAAP